MVREIDDSLSRMRCAMGKDFALKKAKILLKAEMYEDAERILIGK